ncbi:MAG: DUF374 domain-containing protein [Nitrospirota bacterium]
MSKRSDKLLILAGPFLGAVLLKLLRLTLRLKVINRPPKDTQLIFSFWHGRILLMPFMKLSRPSSVMVSRHKDGELIARLVKYFGIASSRGSTTRGGISALKELIKLAREGFSIAFTPDGPKGPRYVVQPGVIQAAKATGLPIYPLTYSARKKKL